MAIYSMGRRRVIVLLLLTSVLLITLDLRGNAVIDRGRSVMSLLLEPFDSAARTISRPVINAWHGITDYDQLKRENEALQAQIDSQRGADIEARASILEFQDLLTLNRLPGSGGYPTVTAQVQGASPSNFQYTVEINKGSTDGIAVGMPVVNGAGLVGKITRVFPNSSIVLLVIDPDFSIGAKVLTAGDPVATTSTTSTTVAGDGASGDGGATGDSGASGDTTTTLGPTGPLAPVPSSTTTTTIDLGPVVTNADGTPADTTTTAASSDAATTDGTAVLDSGQSTEVADPAANGAADESTTSTTVPSGTTTTTVEREVIRETGALTGQGANRPMLLRFVDDSSTLGRVRVGSTVLTAGGNQSIAPAGLPIGQVSAVQPASGSRELEVQVELAAGDLSKLNFVRVLLYVPTTSGS
jgi:rod shape-determining protein MreC